MDRRAQLLHIVLTSLLCQCMGPSVPVNAASYKNLKIDIGKDEARSPFLADIMLMDSDYQPAQYHKITLHQFLPVELAQEQRKTDIQFKCTIMQDGRRIADINHVYTQVFDYAQNQWKMFEPRIIVLGWELANQLKKFKYIDLSTITQFYACLALAPYDLHLVGLQKRYDIPLLCFKMSLTSFAARPQDVRKVLSEHMQRNGFKNPRIIYKGSALEHLIKVSSRDNRLMCLNDLTQFGGVEHPEQGRKSGKKNSERDTPSNP